MYWLNTVVCSWYCLTSFASEIITCATRKNIFLFSIFNHFTACYNHPSLDVLLTHLWSWGCCKEWVVSKCNALISSLILCLLENRVFSLRVTGTDSFRFNILWNTAITFGPSSLLFIIRLIRWKIIVVIITTQYLVIVHSLAIQVSSIFDVIISTGTFNRIISLVSSVLILLNINVIIVIIVTTHVMLLFICILLLCLSVIIASLSHFLSSLC